VTLSAGQVLDEASRAALGSVGALLPRVAPRDLEPPWEVYFTLSQQLPDHFPAGRGGVRAWLDDALLGDPGSTESLSDDDATALLPALCALGHTYRWDSVPPTPERFIERELALPRGLQLPWTELSARFDLPQVGSAWSLHLCNWRLGGPARITYRADDLTLDSLRLAHQWLIPPADAELERFSLSFVLMEARAGVAVQAAAAAVLAAEDRDPHRLAEQLARLAHGLREASRVFVVTMRDEPNQRQRWLELVQPTMAWALPDEHGASLPGPSGLQLPSWQICDTVLGLSRISVLGREAVKARVAMPRKHRDLLVAADACRSTIRDFVKEDGTAVARRRYEEALDALRRFRTAHRVRAARYLRAGRVGQSARVSTGLGVEWRPHGESSDPVEEFEELADARLQEVARASVEAAGGRSGVRWEALSLLSAAEATRLLQCGELRRATDGETILRTGEVNSTLWYVVDGLVRVETHPRNDLAVAVGHLGPGDIFGEISFLTGLPASASVRAEGDIELVSLRRDDIEHLLALDSELATRFHRSLAVSLAWRLRETTSLLTEVETGRGRPHHTGDSTAKRSVAGSSQTSPSQPHLPRPPTEASGTEST
jgi:CRP-like cAMP-binding protein